MSERRNDLCGCPWRKAGPGTPYEEDARGATLLIPLECGHRLVVHASEPPRKKKRCPLCPALPPPEPRRPWRRVTNWIVSRIFDHGCIQGARRRITLECGHFIDTKAAHPIPRKMRCPTCPKVTNQAKGETT